MEKTCDKRSTRLIAYIHHQQCYYVWNTSQHWRKGLFQEVKRSSISWMCRKQTSDSHSSTETEVITWQNQCRPRKKRSFGETNRWSKTKTETYSNVLLQFLFLFLKGRTDIESQRSHDEFSKAIIQLLRHDQSEPGGIDGAIHHYDIMEECRKNEFDGVSQWLHEDWISKLAMRGGAKKILCDSTLSQPIPVFWSSSRTFRRKCHWSCIAREYIDSERIYRVPQPRREREWIEFNDEKLMNSRRKQPQKRKTSGLLLYSEPDGGSIWDGGNSTRSDESKDRVIQEYLETLSKYSISVRFEARPRREICNFTKRGHMQSFSTTHCLQLELSTQDPWKLRMSSTRKFA